MSIVEIRKIQKSVFVFLKILCISKAALQRERERGRKRAPICWFISQTTATARAALVQWQERAFSRSPTRERGPNIWGILHTFPGTLGGECNSQVLTGHPYGYLLCHSSSPRNAAFKTLQSFPKQVTA